MRRFAFRVIRHLGGKAKPTSTALTIGLLLLVSNAFASTSHSIVDSDNAVMLIASAALLLFIGGYHLLLFTFKRKDKTYLFFGLFGIFAALLPVWPEFQISDLTRLPAQGFTLFSLALIPAILYLARLYPTETSRSLVAPTVVVLIAAATFSWFNPLVEKWQMLLPALLATLAFGVLHLILLQRAAKNQRPDVIYCGFAYSLLLGTLLWRGFQTVDENQHGGYFPLLLFALVHSFILARRYRRTIRENEGLLSDLQQVHQELQTYNQGLEQKVSDRTAEIAEQKQHISEQNEKLRELDQYKRRLTSMLVHDLKNPINTVLNTHSRITDESARRLVERSSRQLQQLVSNLLDISRYEDSKLELHETQFPVGALIQEAAGQVSVFLKEKNIDLSLEQGHFQATGDRSLLLRVMVNLLSNAVHYGPQNSTIRISCKAVNEREIEIGVHDEGPGIPVAEQASIFEAFSSGGKTGYGDFKSTGLGLTFCKIVMDAHDGDIKVESEAGKGSVFSIRLQGIAAENDEPGEVNSAPDQKIELSSKQKAAIAETVKQLQQVPIYKVSQIKVLLEELPDEDALAKWKADLLQAVYNSNESEWQELLALASEPD